MTTTFLLLSSILVTGLHGVEESSLRRVGLKATLLVLWLVSLVQLECFITVLSAAEMVPAPPLMLFIPDDILLL